MLQELERGEVRLRRRGGDDLVLVSGRHWDRLADCVRVFAEEAYVRAIAPEQTTRFALGWLGLLRPDDQRACVDELRRTVLAAVESGRLADLEETFGAWRATALATWDDERNQSRPGYADDDVRALPRP